MNGLRGVIERAGGEHAWTDRTEIVLVLFFGSVSDVNVARPYFSSFCIYHLHQSHLLNMDAVLTTLDAGAAPQHPTTAPANPAPTAKDPSNCADPSSPASGATAQSSGLVSGGANKQPTANPPAEYTAQPAQLGFMAVPGIPLATFGGLGGGLASSPNVPGPGTSIDPTTGKPHVAGLTRAELEAKNAATANVGGREQAASQLAGTPAVGPSGGDITPGRELPGGWGRQSSQ